MYRCDNQGASCTRREYRFLSRLACISHPRTCVFPYLGSGKERERADNENEKRRKLFQDVDCLIPIQLCFHLANFFVKHVVDDWGSPVTTAEREREVCYAMVCLSSSSPTHLLLLPSAQFLFLTLNHLFERFIYSGPCHGK